MVTTILEQSYARVRRHIWGKRTQNKTKTGQLTPSPPLWRHTTSLGKCFPPARQTSWGVLLEFWPLMPALKRPHSRKLTFLIRFLSVCGTLFGRNRSSRERVKVIQRIFGRTSAKDPQNLSFPHQKADFFSPPPPHRNIYIFSFLFFSFLRWWRWAEFFFF